MRVNFPQWIRQCNDYVAQSNPLKIETMHGTFSIQHTWIITLCLIGWLDLGTWIWIWVIKIQIPCLDSLQWVKDLDLTNLPRILNL